jgi:hypothetical protein
MHRIRKGQFDLTSMHLKRYHFAVDLDGGSFRSLRSAKHGRFLARLSSLHHSHLDNTRRLIASVQRLGAMVALDDFGAGYTSFPYLRELTADALKIDGEFVRNINGFPANAAIVEAIIGLARNLGMQSIAEWVEDAPTLDMLQAMGVDCVQGFAIARPQSPEVILSATSAADFITDPEILALIGPRPPSHSMDDDSMTSLH